MPRRPSNEGIRVPGSGLARLKSTFYRERCENIRIVSRDADTNMFSLEIECDPDDRDLLIAELWELGSAGIVELASNRVRAFFEDAADRAALQKLYPGSRLRVEEDRDWVQSSRDLMQPMEAGQRFFLVPEWRDDPAPPGRFRIAVNPGMAFGTGVHETTRLCIEALEDYLEPGKTVLDRKSTRLNSSH